MKWFIYSLAIILAIVHQDVWNWDRTDLVLGFMPIGLAYHLMFSLLAGGVWALAVKFAWPTHIEDWADELDQPTTPMAER